MMPIIEKSVNGRNLFVYEVEIEYQLVKRNLQILYDDALKSGKAAEPPAVISGSYTRKFDATDVCAALIASSAKFEAFVQGQDAVIRTQTVRRCDLKFGGHVF